MAKKNLYHIDSGYILIAILLIFSGDPVVQFAGKYGPILVSVLIFVSMYHRLKKDFYAIFLSVAAGLMLIFISQYYVLGFVSWLGALNYINTFFLGALVVYLLGDLFAYKFFIVASYIALISVVLFPFFNLLNLHPNGLEWKPDHITYLIYTYTKEHHFRNCGMFWEPSAFAGVLNLCLALNVKEFPELWKKHKFKLIVIVIALIATQSTAGYIVFFLIGTYFLLFFVKDKTIAFTLLPVLLVVAVIVYTNATFLQQKVESQSESTLTLDKGEFSNTRFGSFIFDMHYIRKHPIVGNGFHESTRYADDPELIQLIEMGENLANANGFSNYMACLGIPFMFLYLLLSYNGTSVNDKRVGLLVLGVILLSLFSEQWLNFPLFAGLVFIKNSKNKYTENKVTARKRYSSNTYLPQSPA